MEKPAPASYPLHPLIAGRWSPRAFDPRPLDPGVLCSLLEAARWAPSSSNAQPWRFCIGVKADDPDSFGKLADLLMPGNALWATTAPVLILAIARKTFAEDDTPNRHAQYDTGSAVENMFLQALSLGVYAHPMAGFDVDKAQHTMNIPADYEPLTMIALGYPGDVETLKEPFHGREIAPRERKSLQDLAFTADFGRVYPVCFT